MAELTAYFNGEWVPNSELKIDPADRGFVMGDVVFDVERTFNGKLFRLKEHMERLYRSLQYSRLDPGLTIEEMSELTEEVARRNEPLRPAGADFAVRQVVTRGKPASVTQGSVTEAMTPTVINSASLLPFKTYAKYYETGATVVIPATRSYPSSSLEPKVKHYSRANFVQAQLQAADVDPDAYVVMMDQSGNISENVGGNFFIVTDGVLRTSKDSSILQGISRMVTMELAEQLGIPVVEEDLQPYDAYTADEAFLTTSSYQVLPVRSVDKREVRHAVPGPISKQLLAAWSEMVGVDIVDQALNQAKS
jgi:branched-chain amino acid aminotransferase